MRDLTGRTRRAVVLLQLLTLAACATRIAGGGVARDEGQPATVVMDTMERDGESFPYRLYVPATAAAISERPLLVMLHGCTQTAADFATGTRMDRFADERGFLVVYVEQPAAHHPLRCWRWYEPAHQRREAGEPAAIAAVVREAISNHAVDPRRVYVAGISAGALMAVTSALAYPDLFAAVAAHSGGAYGVATDVQSGLAQARGGAPDAGHAAARAVAAMGERARVVPLVIVHGDQDATVHPRNAGDLAAQWLAVASMLGRTDLAAGSEDTEVIGGRKARVRRWRDASGEPWLVEWTVEGLAHAWSGGSADGSYTDPHGPDAAELTADFLLRQRRP